MGSELKKFEKKNSTRNRDCAEQENKPNKGRTSCQRKWNFHPWSYSV